MSSLLDTGLQLSLDVNGYTRINNGYLAINRIPGDFTLDVNGTMRVSDGSGTLTLSNDGNSNSVVTLSNVFANKAATLQATGGFFSASGTTGSMSNAQTSNIGVWKKGIVMVAVQDISNATDYVGQISMVRLIGTTYTVLQLSSNSSNASNATITQSGSTSNIVLTNTSGSNRTYTYSITYFPLP
jgi:hypothetical protein